MNNDFECVETYSEKCLECNDVLNFDKCTKCLEGYELDENGNCLDII